MPINTVYIFKFFLIQFNQSKIQLLLKSKNKMSYIKMYIIIIYSIFTIDQFGCNLNQRADSNLNYIKGIKTLDINKLPKNDEKFEITLDEQEILHVKLVGTPTSGYSWFLKNHEKVELTPINIDENGSTSPSIHKNHYGVSATYTFIFVVTKHIEKTNLKFSYERIWSPLDNPIIISVNVTIQKS
jgi:predicted secreted protein